ncbi:unnamed protein product, partial [Polarella glacialis]
SLIERDKDRDAVSAESQAAVEDPVTLSSPNVHTRSILRPGASPADHEPSGSPGVPSPSIVPEPPAAKSPPQLAEVPLLPRFRSRFEPVTEPLPCREIRSEDPVDFLTVNHVGLPAKPVAVVAEPQAFQQNCFLRVVDWTTAGLPVGSGGERSDRPHQADVGAGAKCWGTSVFKQELATRLVKSTLAEAEQAGPPHLIADPLPMIALDLYNECPGPYLAAAFARCCELYERWRLHDSKGL